MYDRSAMFYESDNGYNGNMLYDPSTGTEYEWNRLDLLKKVTSGNGTLVNYSYLADGTKISALDEEGNGLLYRGSLTFRKSGNSSWACLVFLSCQ